MNDQNVYISVKVTHMTEKAVLVNFGAPEPVWIPKSQIQDHDGEDDIDDTVTEIAIPKWLAEERGML